MSDQIIGVALTLETLLGDSVETLAGTERLTMLGLPAPLAR